MNPENPDINPKLLKPYDPKDTESRIYKMWEESGFFNPDICIQKGITKPDAESYCIIMPPPNANGRLHAGHALDTTLKDIVARYHRMQGRKVLMVPGSDHAGFETQGVYEKELQKQGRSRFGMSNDELYKEIYDFVMDKKQYMEADWKKLGVSCDWSRNTFTLDESVVSRVQDTFIKMFNENMIYRGSRIVHWNPKYKTSLSDIETEFIEQKDKFYYFKYGPFVIGTARPETKFADKYVVVNPNDERYAEFTHGQKIDIEWINGPITATVIKDEASDPEIGTGAMTITPWHSQVDFDLAQKYNLEIEQIIDWDGKLLPIAGEFAGMKIAEAREKIVEKLKEKGLVEKIDENYVHSVRICERTGVTIEPQVKPQWFVKMQPLTEMVLKALDKKEFNILSEPHEKIFRHWMNNPVDWNISRQIVWGIQIPAWFKTNTDGTQEYKASKESPGDEWVKDTDTFDTWFSSGQWPLMTLGYPDGVDMQYYPTDLMETGTELIFKWIPRMLMFGKYLTGIVPFKDIYLHGMVLDKNGKKMSKSKGNVISPVDVADEYGIDALRMALIVGTPIASDTALSLEKINAYKKFANKIWNITRFVKQNTFQYEYTKDTIYTTNEINLLNEQKIIFKEITKDIEEYRFHLAAEKIYDYAWHSFADKIIEESKIIFNQGTNEEKISCARFLNESVLNIIRVLHPFMPFITEEIWQIINEKDTLPLIVSPWVI
ncbi:valine--tRNA ligase [Candidatus Nomurabacteria bacterium RIFCSPHIGHO2_02_FULL_33_12]|uniref:Valine--tRNA ligase n=1 Tax=Candidatus Nomurabacteria bacterium RIFCSPLOWO2_01_FULL_33_17 TaxID=1801764 RepID=A0A1F6WMW0_9BACT|nr:MAG: valine--tRNA ligase [Candidatus Nomurabacteria bacterium RIFCSPHIGHO2_02_FULL_33_12]OGI83219.1 MAG: valine--tRNA ligase [Candidatus Nomurabacteria bacterium RIFCSPLOWO2_01_FULL_33_17]